MTRSHCPIFAASSLTLALAGCGRGSGSAAATEQPSRQQVLREAARSTVLCQTSDSTLLRRLGPPSRNGILHRGRVMSWISPNDSLDRYLAVLVDSAGTVVDLYWDVPTEVPWSPTDQCANPD